MIKVIQIAVCITQIFRFVDCAVLDRNRINVNGNQDLNALVNPSFSTDIGSIFSGSTQNSGTIDLIEELSNKPSYITEEAEIPPIKSPNFLIPDSLTTELEKATTQTGLLASPQVDNSLTTLVNSAPTEQNVAGVEEEAPVQGLENLASVIISEIFKGLSKSTNNLTEEIPNFDESKDEEKNVPNSEEDAEEIESFEQINNETVEEIGDEEIDEQITISEKSVAINDDEVDDDADEEEQQEPSENTQDLKSLLISNILGRFSESDKSLDDDDDKDETEEVDEADDNSGLKSIFGILGRTSQKEDKKVSNSITSMKEDSTNTEIDGNIEEAETSEEEVEDESPEEDEMLIIMLKIGNKTITFSKAMNELAKSIKAVSSSCEGLTEGNMICKKNEDKKQDDYKNENTPIETLINDGEADESIFNEDNDSLSLLTETNSNIDETTILPTVTILSESNVKPALLSASF